MKRFYNIFFLTIAFTLISCSGEDYLDDAEYASNQVITEFETNLEIDDLLRGAYFNLGSPNRGSVVSTPVLREAQSDLVSFKTYSGGNIANSFKYSAPIYNREADNNNLTFINNTYAGAFMVLFSANDVLGILEETGGFINEANGQRQVDRMKGESLFLRAYSHYSLATFFGKPYSSGPSELNVPMQLTRPTGALDLPERKTAEEVYTAIINDLKEAINLLPETYDAALGDPESYIDRAKRDAARFLLAKVYFHMGKEFWTSGLDGDGGALEQINAINPESYTLVDGNNITDIYNQRGLGNIASETVWQVAYYYRNGWRVPEYFWLFSSTINDPQNDNNLSRTYSFSNAILNKIGWDDHTTASEDLRYSKLFIRYEKDDSNGFAVDPNYAASYKQQANVWCTKFGPNRNSQVVVFRSPELYLMRANILLETQGAAAAANDLDVIRQRATPGIAKIETPTEADIELEWIKEFAFEGRRLFYLQALKKEVPPGDRNGGAIPYDDESLVRKFPANEISRNPNLQ